MAKLQSDIERLFPEMDINKFSFLPLLENFYEGITVMDSLGHVLFMNDEQARMDDIQPETIVGKKVTEIYQVDDGISPTMQCLKTGRQIKGMACYYRTNLGKLVNSIHNIFPLYEGEKLLGAICFIQDFSTIEQRFDFVSKSKKINNFHELNRFPAGKCNRQLGNGTCFSFRDIIGESREFLEAIEMGKLAAQSTSSVMLFGDTGTGKELFAQSIHNHSPRKTENYVAVNCAAIPENLLEGILFGTSKGAFTGAVDKQGLFEKANGGTLFLDEINSMTVGLQAKLLRFLQERKVRRVGSLKEIEVDCKLISSVNQNPHTSIANGQLRSDLFYRLAVVFIRIPPLVERLDDLQILISHFLQKCNTLMGKKINALSGEVLTIFEQYPWPGNVRELEHVIEGAMNLTQTGETIMKHHLSAHLNLFFETSDKSEENTFLHSMPRAPQQNKHGRINYYFPPPSIASHNDKTQGQHKIFFKKRNEKEMNLIRDALEKTSGRPSASARLLGISPQLLNYKMKKYGINRKEYTS